jgi:hypothetical protein
MKRTIVAELNDFNSTKSFSCFSTFLFSFYFFNTLFYCSAEIKMNFNCGTLQITQISFSINFLSSVSSSCTSFTQKKMTSLFISFFKQFSSLSLKLEIIIFALRFSCCFLDLLTILFFCCLNLALEKKKEISSLVCITVCEMEIKMRIESTFEN